jgi:hypothetical protein
VVETTLVSGVTGVTGEADGVGVGQLKTSMTGITAPVDVEGTAATGVAVMVGVSRSFWSVGPVVGGRGYPGPEMPLDPGPPPLD